MHRIEPFRTIDLSQAGAPDGMRGCGQCQFGLIDPPPVNMSASLHSVRTVQASLRQLTFCTCAAGKAYRRHLVGEFRAVRDTEYAKTPEFYDKVTREVRAQAVAPAMAQADIDAALADLDEVHVPTINGVAYADA